MFFLPSYTFADTTYKVKKGDSLYKISKKFKVSIDEIKIKNNKPTNPTWNKLCAKQETKREIKKQ
jgi:LysM repeat protein